MINRKLEEKIKQIEGFCIAFECGFITSTPHYVQEKIYELSLFQDNRTIVILSLIKRLNNIKKELLELKNENN